MTVDQLELRTIPRIVTPVSLKWEDFAQRYLDNIDPNFHGDIANAFGVAKAAHKHHAPRETGEPFFSHPLMTAIYLVEAGCTHPSHLVASLLHDVPEDEQAYLKAVARKLERELEFEEYWDATAILDKFFGVKVEGIVIALTKPDGNLDKQEVERRFIKRLGMGPVDAWIVKAADRLHNLRTLPTDDLGRVQRKIAETREGYLPLFREAAQWFPGEGTVLLRAIEMELDELEKII